MPVIIDAGVGTYTRQTFSSERYTIWTMQSNYHNLPMINGVPQKYGRQYKATEVKATKNSFSANIATAYPDEAGVKKWIRSYTMKSDALMISDRFELNEIKKENVINFLSWGDIIIKDGVIEISVNGVKGTLKYDTKMFKVKKECVKLTDKNCRLYGERRSIGCLLLLKKKSKRVVILLQSLFKLNLMRENIYGYFKIVIKLLCSSNCLWVGKLYEKSRIN